MPEQRLKIWVNGAATEVAAGSLAHVLAELGYDCVRVATAVDGEFVPERERASVTLRDGARIEVVAPRQGG